MSELPLYDGIDCADALDRPADGHPTLYDALVARNRSYAWVGRYLCDIYAVSTGLTHTEVSFAHQRAIAIPPIYNGLLPNDVSAGFDRGHYHATRAVALARAIRMPHGVVIYADVEASWWPSVSFFQGWHEGFDGSGYLPGVYGNLAEPAFAIPYNAAFRGSPAMQKGAFLWSNEPEWSANRPQQFTPTRPGVNNERVVLWQYWENVEDGLIDLDLATSDGYGLMWVPMFIVQEKCALKKDANHECEAIATILPGTHIRRTGQQIDAWVQVHTPNGYTGWILKSNLVAG